MNDEIAMGEFSNARHFADEPQALLNGEQVRFAILGDCESLHILQDKIRAAVPGDTAIEQWHNAGVREPGEDLTLLAKAGDAFRAGPTGAKEFQSDALLVFLVVPGRFVNLTHATAADDTE